MSRPLRDQIRDGQEAVDTMRADEEAARRWRKDTPMPKKTPQGDQTRARLETSSLSRDLDNLHEAAVAALDAATAAAQRATQIENLNRERVGRRFPNVGGGN